MLEVEAMVSWSAACAAMCNYPGSRRIQHTIETMTCGVGVGKVRANAGDGLNRYFWVTRFQRTFCWCGCGLSRHSMHNTTCRYNVDLSSTRCDRSVKRLAWPPVV